jgi:hypothetical protein
VPVLPYNTTVLFIEAAYRVPPSHTYSYVVYLGTE